MQERDYLKSELEQDSTNSQPASAMAERPLLLVLTGAPGAGKTTFYEAKLRESFPILLKPSASPLEQPLIEQQQKELLKAHKSFVFQTSLVDMDLLEGAQSHGFEVKVIFIGTEHPDLNIARVLSRVSRGGSFAPVATLHDQYENGLHHLKRVAKATDELVLLDNTADGRSPSVVAQFVGGEIAKLSRSTPEWAQNVFGREFEQWLRTRTPSRERER